MILCVLSWVNIFVFKYACVTKITFVCTKDKFNKLCLTVRRSNTESGLWPRGAAAARWEP